MPSRRIGLEQRGAVAWLTIDSHERLLPPELADEIAGTLAALADGGDGRVVVLRGAGTALAHGWDRAAARQAGAGPDAVRRLSAALRAVADSPLPVIAALDGDVLNAGLELALVCDVRLAAAGARLGFPESAGGLLPLGGGGARLARLAGRGVALKMLLTGDPLTAEQALACGLVSGVYPTDQLASEAERLAAVIADRGPLAVRFAKEAVARGTEMPLDQALRYETDLTIILQTTADRAEGVRAFAEKRPPRFRGE